MAFGKVTEDNVYTCVGQYFIEICHINLLHLPKKGINPLVQGTPFDLILQTSQTGLLMKTSPQPTSNIAVKFVLVQFCCLEVLKIELVSLPAK